MSLRCLLSGRAGSTEAVLAYSCLHCHLSGGAGCTEAVSIFVSIRLFIAIFLAVQAAGTPRMLTEEELQSGVDEMNQRAELDRNGQELDSFLHSSVSFAALCMLVTPSLLPPSLPPPSPPPPSHLPPSLPSSCKCDCRHQSVCPGG